MPVSSELLDILVCPETKQPVRLATEAVLAAVNAKIQAGSLRHGVLIQVGWRVPFSSPFLLNRNTEYPYHF